MPSVKAGFRFLLLCWAFLWSGCAAETNAATQIVVAVNADEVLAEKLDAIDVVARGVTKTFALRGDDRVKLPFSFAVKPYQGEGPRLLSVVGRMGKTTLVMHKVKLAFQSGRTLLYRVWLSDACREVRCGADETCGACGECRPQSIDELEQISPEGDGLGAWPAPRCGPGLEDGGLDGSSTVTPADDGGHDGSMTGGDATTMEGGTSEAGMAEKEPCEIRVPKIVTAAGCYALSVSCGPSSPAEVELTVSGGKVFSTSDCAAETEVTAPTKISGSQTSYVYLTPPAADSAKVHATTADIKITASGFEQRVEVSLRKRAKKILLMRRSTCVLLDDAQHTVQCLGRSYDGGLGMDLSDGQEVIAVPTTAPGLLTTGGIESWEGGSDHGCVLARDSSPMATGGSAMCWGNHFWGHLGVIVASSQSRLLEVTGLSNGVTDLSVGAEHSCALRNGAMYCWGRNPSGQVAPSDPAKDTPFLRTDLAAGTTPVRVAAGEQHSCVAYANGRVQCWGDNGGGQLGAGTASSTSPQDVPMPADSNVTDLWAGGLTTCARLTPKTGAGSIVDGDVYCWGKEASASPSKMFAGAAGVVDLALSYYTHCARSDSKVWCWGRNEEGWTGTGSSAERLSAPLPVRLPQGQISDLAIARPYGFGSCAIVDGVPYCWGFYHNANFGSTEDVGDFLLPKRVTTFDALSNLSSMSLSRATYVDSATNCAIADGALWCWGFGAEGELMRAPSGAVGSYSEIPVRMPGFEQGVEQVEAGGGAVIVRQAGAAWTWGANYYGQLGRGPSTIGATTTPEKVDLKGTVLDVALGYGTACAVTEEPPATVGGLPKRSLYCWGHDFQGLVGNGSVQTDDTPTPSLISSDDVSDVCVGPSIACAISSAGRTVLCWGPSISNGASSPVTQVMPTLDTDEFWKESAAGNDTACFRSNKGRVACAGQGNKAPVGARVMTTLAGAAAHFCAIDQAGALFCWGENGSGQLGQGSRMSAFGAVQVTKNIVGPVTLVGVGGNGDVGSTCAKDQEGWKCFGNNTQRQFGLVPFVQREPAPMLPWTNDP